MLAQGIGAEQLTQFISALNDALTRRVLELNLHNHHFDGVEWAWLAFGSEGRDEQTFSTDQDNGIVFTCPDAAEVKPLRKRFLAFALDVNKDLDRCGFPLCKGNIMASNPQWCLTLDEWKNQFSKWVRSPEPDALLNASIFFDFRALFGNAELAEQMRRFLLTATGGNSLFLQSMARNALSVAPPLGTIRDFITDLEPGNPGKIDLKKYGSRISMSPEFMRWPPASITPTRYSACASRRSDWRYVTRRSTRCSKGWISSSCCACVTSTSRTSRVSRATT
jgi:CBS domain-containing protein